MLQVFYILDQVCNFSFQTVLIEICLTNTSSDYTIIAKIGSPKFQKSSVIHWHGPKFKKISESSPF